MFEENSKNCLLRGRSPGIILFTDQVIGKKLYMKCVEVFVSEREAEVFVKGLMYDGAEPEIIKTYESEDSGREVLCWAVYFNPPRKEIYR